MINPIERHNIQFVSEGQKCLGWFYRTPKKNQAPCIILAHGFGGVKEMRLDAYAEKFAEAGYHALVFDYRHFGESDGLPRQILDIKKQHQDWHSAIAFARDLPEVENEKIVLWGTSFSGGHVISVSLKDNHVAAVISQVPHLNGTATALANGFLQNIRLSIAAFRDLVHLASGREPYYVDTIGEPGTLAAMTAPGAVQAARKLYPEGFRPVETVAARIFLSVGTYSPGQYAAQLTIPWLVQVAANDLTTPVGQCFKAAVKTPKSQLIMYPCGHFDMYVNPQFELTVNDQIRFLDYHLK